MNSEIASLAKQYEGLKAENPKLRIRDAAKQLGVSEAHLVAINSENIALKSDFFSFLKELAPLGNIMALTRNDDVVHERKGIYDNVSFEGPVGTAVNPDIDIRMFMMAWKFGFAVNENGRRSFQFFDKAGDATHKIYATDLTNMEAFDALIEKYKSDEPIEIVVEAWPATPAEMPDSSIDAAAFKEEWLNMKDTHDFYGMLRKYRVSREQGLRLAPDGWVKKVENTTFRKVMETAAERQVPIMVFVGNRGTIQIHTGEVSKLVDAGPWFNVLDPDFNLHLKEGSIHSSYIVKKNSVDGTITSLETFDKNGEMIVQLFGKRKPGIPELETWRDLIKDVVDF